MKLKHILGVTILIMQAIIPAKGTAQSDRPNIIFILSDDHAYQATSAYGNKLVSTPNIDRIAREGAILYKNFVVNSICGPSRATLLTGKYSHKNGYALNEKTFDVNQETFPVLLQQNGYQTAWIGKLHLGSLPIGFDYFNILPGQGHYYNPDFINNKNDTIRNSGYVTNLISDFFFDWLQQRDTTKPFFAVVGEKATHRSWLPDIPDLGAYDSIDFPLPETFYDNYENRLAAFDQDMTIDKTMRLKEDLKIGASFGENGYEAARMNPEQAAAYTAYYGRITREFESKKLSGKALAEWKFQRYLKDYYATAKSLDRNIGKILRYLDSTGLSRNTVVIYASDQGFYLGEHGWFDKRFIYEESLRTPFVIRYPGVVKPGTKINSFVSNTDWNPTILDIAGVKAPGEVQGRSILPVLQGKTPKDWRKEQYYHYYEFPEPHHVSPHFGIRTNDHLLVRFYGSVESWELYDLKKDPSQVKNLYTDPKYAKTIVALKQQLKAQILQYDDQEALKIFAEPIK